jgi:hypothetical protein
MNIYLIIVFFFIILFVLNKVLGLPLEKFISVPQNFPKIKINDIGKINSNVIPQDNKLIEKFNPGLKVEYPPLNPYSTDVSMEPKTNNTFTLNKSVTSNELEPYDASFDYEDDADFGHTKTEVNKFIKENFDILYDTNKIPTNGDNWNNINKKLYENNMKLINLKSRDNNDIVYN